MSGFAKSWIFSFRPSCISHVIIDDTTPIWLVNLFQRGTNCFLMLSVHSAAVHTSVTRYILACLKGAYSLHLIEDEWRKQKNISFQWQEVKVFPEVGQYTACRLKWRLCQVKAMTKTWIWFEIYLQQTKRQVLRAVWVNSLVIYTTNLDL